MTLDENLVVFTSAGFAPAHGEASPINDDQADRGDRRNQRVEPPLRRLPCPASGGRGERSGVRSI